MTYSNSLAFSRQKFIAKNQNVISYKSRYRTLGPVSNTIILVLLSCVLGLLYLTQVTKTNSYGYKINDLRTQYSQLKDENHELELASARLQSLDRVKNSEVAKSLVSVANPETLQN